MWKYSTPKVRQYVACRRSISSRSDAVRQPRKSAHLDHAVEVGRPEAELGGLEQRMTRGLVGERVQVGLEVAELTVGVHEAEDAEHRLGVAAQHRLRGVVLRRSAASAA
jgi:hypothetical protein